MNNVDKYKAKVYCTNCNFKEEIEIPKGKKIDETACPRCGTLELDKDINVNLDQGNFYGNEFNSFQ